MGYEAFLTIGIYLFLVSAVGYKWGIIEKAADEFLDHSLGG